MSGFSYGGKMIINAVSYARFSSNNQREASIEIQQEYINKYCRDNGLTIIREYVDRALSATSDNRPQFQEMINDSRSGLFTFVVVYNSSRFCRNIQDHLRYRSILESNGVRLICVNENFDETTPEGDLMANFMMSINQYYSRDLGRKAYLGCLETAKECKHVGGPTIYGYRVGPDQKYVIDEEEAKGVKLIFDLLEANYTSKQIADILAERGIKKRNGKPFVVDFYRFAKNRKYIGEYFWNTGTKKNKVFKYSESGKVGETDQVIIPNGMPAIISEEQFERVQRILSKKRTSHPTKGKYEYLLSGLIKCGNCGYNMCVDRNINGNGKGLLRLNYRCYSKNARRCECNTKDIQLEKLDTYIYNLLTNVLLNERYSKSIYKFILNKIDKRCKQKRLEIDTKWARVREIEEEIQNLVKVLAGARTIAYQEIVKEIERLSKSKDNVLKEINEIEDNLNEMPSFTEKTIQNNIVEMKKALKPKIVKNVKPMLTYLLDEIVYSNEEIQVHVNLNAYIGSSLHGTFKAVILEETDNVKKVENQFKQKLTWNTLCIAT